MKAQTLRRIANLAALAAAAVLIQACAGLIGIEDVTEGEAGTDAETDGRAGGDSTIAMEASSGDSSPAPPTDAAQDTEDAATDAAVDARADGATGSDAAEESSGDGASSADGMADVGPPPDGSADTPDALDGAANPDASDASTMDVQDAATSDTGSDAAAHDGGDGGEGGAGPEGGSTEAAADAPPDSAPVDGGTDSTLDGSGEAGTDSGSTFCGAQGASVVFCADFDEAQSAGVAAGWSQGAALANGMVGFDDTHSVSPPASLLAKAFSSSSANLDALLSTNLALTASTFDLRFDMLLPTPGMNCYDIDGWGVANFNVTSSYGLILELVPDGSLTLLQLIEFSPSVLAAPMTIHDIGDLPSLPSSGWLSVDLHVELGASPPTATISLIGSVTTGQTVQLMLTPVPGAAASPELDLGPQYFSPTTNATTDCQINFDDVVVSSP